MGTRRYDSPLRREQMSATRAKIVAAGAELVRTFESWDWDGLTFRAVAERAGVGERTVYRHFPTERELHDAIMARLSQDAGVDYDDLELSQFVLITGRVFSSLSGFNVGRTVEAPRDPTFVAVDEQRRAALLRAVEVELPESSDERRRHLAAALDVLWSPTTFERLVTSWGMDEDEAMAVVETCFDALLTSAREAGRSLDRSPS